MLGRSKRISSCRCADRVPVLSRIGTSRCGAWPSALLTTYGTPREVSNARATTLSPEPSTTRICLVSSGGVSSNLDRIRSHHSAASVGPGSWTLPSLSSTPMISTTPLLAARFASPASCRAFAGSGQVRFSSTKSPSTGRPSLHAATAASTRPAPEPDPRAGIGAAGSQAHQLTRPGVRHPAGLLHRPTDAMPREGPQRRLGGCDRRARRHRRPTSASAALTSGRSWTTRPGRVSRARLARSASILGGLPGRMTTDDVKDAQPLLRTTCKKSLHVTLGCRGCASVWFVQPSDSANRTQRSVSDFDGRVVYSRHATVLHENASDGASRADR